MGCEVARTDKSYPQKPESNEDWTRSFGGGLITFKDGAAVSKVCMPTDFSAVRLDNLPPHSDPAAVSRFLNDIGITDKLASTRILPSTDPHSAHCSAEVKVEDPSFARRLCAKVATSADSQVKAVAIAAPAPVSTGHRRIDCRKIACSWHRPVKIVWLNFGNQDIASKVQTRFASGVYKILDHQVEAGSPTGQDNRRNPLGWTVTLSAVPGRAGQADVSRAIPEHWRPRRINVGDPTYKADADTARASVKSMLMDIGPLAWWEDTSGPDSKREKALARYVDDADAQRAASTLNNAPLTFAQKAGLVVQAFTTAKFRVLTRIYKAVEPRIDAHRMAWKDARMWFTCYASVNGYNVLKIEGEKRQDVANAADTLEKILAGEVATADGTALWSPSLRSNNETYEKVKAIERDAGIVILRNKRKCQMRLYGPADRCEQARNLLATVVREDSASTFSLRVAAKQLQWAQTGGLRSIARALGGSRATLDDLFNPKAILISGSDDDHRRAKALLDAQDPSATTDGGEDADCCVCWTPAEDPVHTNCGHTYCGDCFENLCEAAFTSNDPQARVVCKGDGDQCKTTLSLQELEENLSMEAMEALLESSFKSHVARHPLEFRYCPSPDCGMVYRAGTGRTHTCPRCVLVTCTSCHVKGGHAGISCAEHKARGSGTSDADRKLMRELGVKECPRCKTAIEKTYGCNHMTCGGCGVHICWKCMEIFSAAKACYAHLAKVHGGPVDVEW